MFLWPISFLLFHFFYPCWRELVFLLCDNCVKFWKQNDIVTNYTPSQGAVNELCVGLGRLGNIFTALGSSDSPGTYALAAARPTGLLYFVHTVLFPSSLFLYLFPFYFILAVPMRRWWGTVCAWKREKRNKPKQQRKKATKKEWCMKKVQWVRNKDDPTA